MLQKSTLFTTIWVFPQYLRLFPDQFYFHLPFYGIMTIVVSRKYRTKSSYCFKNNPDRKPISKVYYITKRRNRQKMERKEASKHIPTLRN